MSSEIFGLGYILALVLVIVILYRKVNVKRTAIKEKFGIATAAQRNISVVDSELHSLIILNWALFFVLVMVFLMPVLIYGRSILLLVEILVIEAVTLILGAIAVTLIGIADWHIECAIPQQSDFKKSILLIFIAILLANISYVSYELPFYSSWGAFEFLAIIVSLFAFWFTTKPIRRECDYYVS